MMLNSVDLPQPDGPMIETNWPAAIANDTSSTAVIVPSGVGKRLTMCATSSNRGSRTAVAAKASAAGTISRVLMSVAPPSVCRPATHEIRMQFRYRVRYVERCVARVERSETREGAPIGRQPRVSLSLNPGYTRRRAGGQFHPKPAEPEPNKEYYGRPSEGEVTDPGCHGTDGTSR